MSRIDTLYNPLMSRILLLLTLFLTAITTLSFGQTEITLGRANSFSALAANKIQANGPLATTVYGYLGTSPGKDIGEMQYLNLLTGRVELDTELAQEAMRDAQLLYNNLRTLPVTSSINPTLGGGNTLGPGVYHINGNATLSGTLLLDGQGNFNSVFVFIIDGSLRSNAGSVQLSEMGASAKNVYWVVRDGVDIGAPGFFQGNIIANETVTLGSNVTLIGRAISLKNDVIFNANLLALQSVVEADLEVKKETDASNISLGSLVTYTITATNKGPGVARNVAVIERIPLGLRFVRAEGATKGFYDSIANQWVIGDMVAGDTESIKVVFEVTGTGNIRNEVVVIGDDPDPNPNDDEDDAELPELPDLAITKTLITQPPYSLGDELIYTLTVTNKARTAQTNVRIEEQLPEELALLGFTPQAGVTFDPVTNIFTIAEVPGNSSVTITLRTKILKAGNIRNIATIIDRTPDNDKDPDNDEDVVEIELPDLGVTKTIIDQKDSYMLNDVIVYEIKVTNNAKTAQTNVNVSEVLAEGLQYISSSASIGSYNQSTGLYTIQTLPGMTTATLRITAKIVRTGNIRNVATIIGRTPDNDKDPDNNEEEVEIVLPDLGVTKEVVTQGPYYVGDVVQYKIIVTNYANLQATNIKVKEELPSGLLYVSHAVNMGEYDRATHLFTIPALAAGTPAVLTITAQIVESGNIRNVVAIVDGNPGDPSNPTNPTNPTDPGDYKDSDPGNNDDDVVIPVTCRTDLSVSLTTSADTYCASVEGLVITATEIVGATYTWKLPNTTWAIVGASNTNSITVKTGATGGKYSIQVEVKDQCGKIVSSTPVEVTIEGPLTKPASISGGVNFCEGREVTLETPAVTGATSYVWTLPADWEVIANNGREIQVKVGKASGKVSVQAKNDCYTSEVLEKEVIVVPQPTAETFTLSSDKNALCEGDQLVLTATEVPNAKGYAFTVTGGLQLVKTEGNRVTVKAGATGGAVSVTITDFCDRTLTVSKDITVTPKLANVNITGAAQVCRNSTNNVYTASTYEGTVTYTWTATGGLTITKGAGTSQVEVSAGTTGGNLTVEVSNGCFTVTKTFLVGTITPPTLPTLISGSNDVCEGSTLTYSVTNVAGVNYTWTAPAGWTVAGNGASVSVTVGADSGKLLLTASDDCGNSKEIELLVNVTRLPVAPGITGPATACAGEEVTYTLNGTAAGVTYTWNVTGWAIKGATTGNGITVIAGSGAGNISVTASNKCNAVSSSMAVGITPIPASPGAISHDVNVCQNTAGNVISVAEVPGATSYTWNLPEGWEITSVRNTNVITVTTTNAGGLVSVTANNCTGSSAPTTTTITITAPPAPVTRITDNSNVCDGLVYTADLVDGATSYTWEVTEGFTIESGQGTPTIKVKAANPNALGRVSVITYTGGCVGSAAYSIDIDAKLADGQLDFPKAFSPNGDGKNDTWLVKNLDKFPDNELVIFNRWGSEVFKQKNYKNDWTAQGLGQGTYFYKMQVKLCDGKYQEYSGYLTVFR
jgi:gliding motility-associated-like protein/uncharacterized repeat protein (TIGR01451 family)